MDVYVGRLSHRLRRRLTGNRQQNRAQARYLGLPGSMAAYSKCQVSIRRGTGFHTSGLGAARTHVRLPSLPSDSKPPWRRIKKILAQAPLIIRDLRVASNP